MKCFVCLYTCTAQSGFASAAFRCIRFFVLQHVVLLAIACLSEGKVRFAFHIIPTNLEEIYSKSRSESRSEQSAAVLFAFAVCALHVDGPEHVGLQFTSSSYDKLSTFIERDWIRANPQERKSVWIRR